MGMCLDLDPILTYLAARIWVSQIGLTFTGLKGDWKIFTRVEKRISV